MLTPMSLKYKPIIFLATHSNKLHINCINFLRSLKYNLKPINDDDLYNTREIIAYRDVNQIKFDE